MAKKVEVSSSNYQEDVFRIWLIDNNELGCPADVSLRKRCALTMPTGTRILDYEREGFWSQGVNGSGYPFITIRSPSSVEFFRKRLACNLKGQLGINIKS